MWAGGWRPWKMDGVISERGTKTRVHDYLPLLFPFLLLSAGILYDPHLINHEILYDYHLKLKRTCSFLSDKYISLRTEIYT